MAQTYAMVSAVGWADGRSREAKPLAQGHTAWLPQGLLPLHTFLWLGFRHRTNKGLHLGRVERRAGEALGMEGACPQGHRVGTPATPTSPSFPPGPEVTAGTWQPPCVPCRAGRRSCSCPGAEGQPAGHGWRRGVLPPGPAVKVKVPGDGREGPRGRNKEGNGQRERERGRTKGISLWTQGSESDRWTPTLTEGHALSAGILLKSGCSHLPSGLPVGEHGALSPRLAPRGPVAHLAMNSGNDLGGCGGREDGG